MVVMSTHKVSFSIYHEESLDICMEEMSKRPETCLLHFNGFLLIEQYIYIGYMWTVLSPDGGFCFRNHHNEFCHRK